MTREEKRDAIKRFCKDFGDCSNPFEFCPLRPIPGTCYSKGADIDRNYDILVKAGLISPDDEIETADDKVERKIETAENSDNTQSCDVVNHPTHYTKGGIECIQAIKASMTSDGFCDYCKGNVLKYLWRWRGKGGVEDLQKAKVYLDWLIEAAKGCQNG